MIDEPTEEQPYWKRSSYSVTEVADKISRVRGDDDVTLSDRWTIVNALWGEPVGTWARDDQRMLVALDSALRDGDAALRFVREVTGESALHVEWLWDSFCQGHYAEVTATIDGMYQQGSATGSSLALAMIAATLRWRVDEPVKQPGDDPGEKRQRVELKVVR